MNFRYVPDQASSYAAHYDLIFYALVALTVVFSLLVGVLVLTFAIKYRAGNKVNRARPIYESKTLELTWSIIPLILGLIMFFFGAQLFVQMRTPPDDAMEVFVIGKQWMWHVQHPNGVRENNTLHVPIGKPVKLTMISQDVIHAFYIPDFRLQYHVVPGRYTSAWFTGTKIGKYPIFCGIYCGTQHSEMGGYVYVMSQKDFAAWLDNGGERPVAQTMEQRGSKLFTSIGCANCHGGADTLRAPSLNGIWNSKRTMEDGTVVTADAAYLRESILNPWNRITKGYQNTMPEYVGQIKEEDVLALIEYIRSTGQGAVPASPAAPNLEAGTGLQTTQPFVDRSARPAVGAIEATERQTPGQPSTGNLSVGAMAAEKQGGR